METRNQQSHILAKKAVLETASKQLKKEFIGLDGIIDEIMDLIRPWWLFPGAQTRPMVINLWGMTGCGKTALVRRLVELLDMDQAYVQVDTGEFRDNSEVWLKTFLAEDLVHHSGKPSVVCLDEFQFARSIGEGGNELNAEKLRIIWEMLDSGQFYYNPIPSQYMIKKAMQCVELLYLCREDGVKMEEGKIISGKDVFKRHFKGYTFGYRYGKPEKPKTDFFISTDFLNGLFNLVEDRYATISQIKQEIKMLDIDGLIDFVIDAANYEGSLKLMDLTQSLVFVIGNLDEAYYMSRNINPDISADEFHHYTLKITVADVKKALQRRFRNEQIARLGNNHILYPAFDSQNFRDFIQAQLKRIEAFGKKQFGIKFIFAESVKKIIYEEGVFPTQGVRPVMTTVRNLVESYVSRLICDLAERNLKVHQIRWKFKNQKHWMSCYDKKGNKVWKTTYAVRLKINPLRESQNDDVQAHTAVHEAGHAILAALSLRILPEAVLTQTADSGSQGFCQIRFPEGMRTKDILRKDIIISLGGLVAERMIFGPEQTSTGVVSDLESASELANQAIKDYGMGKDPTSVHIEDPGHYDSFFHNEDHETQAMEIIKSCEAEAEAILLRNKHLLLRMSHHLTIHSRMDQAEIGACVSKYAVEPWVATHGFIEPEKYFDFKGRIHAQLALIEGKEVSSEKVKPMRNMAPVRGAAQTVALEEEKKENLNG
ncbi:MAG: hypothetical protein AAF587_13555 [Bacteroidota bacterium]